MSINYYSNNTQVFIVCLNKHHQTSSNFVRRTNSKAQKNCVFLSFTLSISFIYFFTRLALFHSPIFFFLYSQSIFLSLSLARSHVLSFFRNNLNGWMNNGNYRMPPPFEFTIECQHEFNSRIAPRNIPSPVLPVSSRLPSPIY